MSKVYSEKVANKVYDGLVEICGAYDSDDIFSHRHRFVNHHVDQDSHKSEWRFGGNLGYGGKFWFNSHKNAMVSCYSENENPERLEAIEKMNTRLIEIEKDI